MLRRTFLHLPTIGSEGERRLWSLGINDWKDLRDHAPELIAPAKLDSVLRQLDVSEEAYAAKDPALFFQTIPHDEHWRIVPEFFDRLAFLDIETTGFGMPPKAHSTTVTFYYKGIVLQEYESEGKRRLIQGLVAENPILVTFFGTGFDVPFLSREYGIEFDLPHLDLCPWLKRHGFSGGLKKVQKLFADIPDRVSMDIDGYDAVKLWRMHQRGIPGALETLLTYNAEDTVVLEPLVIKAYELDRKRYAEFEAPELIARPMAELRTRVFPEIYARLRPPEY